MKCSYCSIETIFNGIFYSCPNHLFIATTNDAIDYYKIKINNEMYLGSSKRYDWFKTYTYIKNITSRVIEINEFSPLEIVDGEIDPYPIYNKLMGLKVFI